MCFFGDGCGCICVCVFVCMFPVHSCGCMPYVHLQAQTCFGKCYLCKGVIRQGKLPPAILVCNNDNKIKGVIRHGHLPPAMLVFVFACWEVWEWVGVTACSIHQQQEQHEQQAPSERNAPVFVPGCVAMCVLRVCGGRGCVCAPFCVCDGIRCALHTLDHDECC